MIPRLDAFYHRDIYPPRDGTAIYVDGVMRALSERFSVRLFTYSDSKKPSSHVVSHNYEVYSVPRLRIPLLSTLATSPKAKRLHDAVAALDPRLLLAARELGEADYVLCIEPFCSPGVAFFSRLRGKNVIFRASDCILSLGIHWMRTSEPVGLLAAMYALVFERLTSRLAHLIIVPSEKTKRLFEEHHGVQEDKLFVSPHGYDEKRYSLADDGIRDSLRSKYSLTSEDFLIVFVGSGDWIPNRIAIKYLGDYLAPFLNTELPRAKIIVVGRKTEEFKNLESRNLQVIGEVEDVVPYLVAADLGIAPMKTTGGMSVKAAEYLMMGLPVIATPEVTETIGRLKGVTETDIEHFHLAVLESARGMTINKSVRKRIRQEAVRNFSWDRIGANLTDFIWKSFNGPE